MTASTDSEDERFMSIALDCARRGRGAVEPNPMVGAVLARDGVELARGWHRSFGAPHAEIEALDAARSAGRDVHGATMYVTLEPCCHHGKTPPCTEAIIQAGVARVVAAMVDPDVNVSSAGLAALHAAGVEVAVGVLQAEARELLAAYVKLRTTGRPWVICKWAQTADGYLALPAVAGRWISGRQSRAAAHQLRAVSDGVCVGVGTVLADDPLLTNRSGSGRQPSRLVLDSRLRIPLDCRLIATAGRTDVIVATTAEALTAEGDRARRLRDTGAELLEVPPAAAGVDLPALLDELGRRNWTRLLVEGGPKVLESFLFASLADELVTFVAPRTVDGRAGGLPALDIRQVQQRLSLGPPETTNLGRDVMMRHVLREKK